MAQVVRTRTFDPEDIHHRTEEEVQERIRELKEKRDSFDPETQFTGLSRLGSRYTVAEPFAFFDGPTDKQRQLNYALAYGSMAMAALIGSMMDNKIRRGAYLTGLGRGLLLAPVAAYFGGKFYEYIVKRRLTRQNTLFHYALLHENDLPIIERKTYGEIITDWPAHRSLNRMGELKWN